MERNGACFEYAQIRNAEKIKLFCFHHAGGSASFFSDWYKGLSEEISVYPVQLKGRGFEDGVKPYGSMEEAGSQIACEIYKIRNGPLYFYGHSMGGVLAYYTAYVLQSHYGLTLDKLFVSGSIPTLGELTGRREKRLFQLSDEDFCKFLLDYGAIDNRILSIPQFHQFFLPVIRSDFEMTERFRADPAKKLLCDTVVYGGTQDRIVDPSQLRAWDTFTRGSVLYRLFDGDHFFIKKHRKAVLSDINKQIAGGDKVDNQNNKAL